LFAWLLRRHANNRIRKRLLMSDNHVEEQADAGDDVPVKVSAPRRSRKKVPVEEQPATDEQEPQAKEAGSVEEPSTAVADQPSTVDIPINNSAEALANEIHEIEVEVRNAGSAQNPASAVSELAANSLRLVAENLGRMAEPQLRTVRTLLDRFELGDYLDPDFWQGIGMVLRYQIESQIDFIQRRMRGEYEVDPYGMDREIIEIVRPFHSFMYRSWWRTSTEGAEKLPAEGRVLLVANHSGVLPWDATQISTAVAEERSDLAERVVRPLYLNEFRNLPFLGQLLAALGQVPAIPENATNLLEGDEIVCAFPEGAKGAGKLFKDRYRLARFGRGQFIASALRTGAPIVPVAVIGAEETYPMLANVEPLARLFGAPYFPMTPFFPWLGPLGLTPLPTRWKIIFGEPLQTTRYGADTADDPLTVFMLSEQIRSTIQETIDEHMVGRAGLF
jgi:1-acyl-sn-glycerol-3-phosphate acyltransferase